ncbi:MAG: pyrroloquinoline quinone-dependent dehydrogenase [Acidobacteriota bacterium]|nr:pyrroloquinoline quinone-dependent dehydrogenase [Acidobacteriota bacterium]
MKGLIRSVVCGGLALSAPATILPQSGAVNGEWRSYAGDTGASKYSPLEQIDADNFGSLEVAWQWQSADATLCKTESQGEWCGPYKQIFAQLQREDPDRWRAGRDPMIRNLKATPLMVGGRLYLNTPISQGAAVDAATGETLWVYNPKTYEAGTTSMTVIWNQRGVAYWDDSGEAPGRVFWGTGDGYLICVLAASGRPCDGFGEAGRVDLMAGIPRANRGERDYLNALLYSVQSPPIVVRDVVMTPVSIADRRILKESVPGWVRGFDVRTGAMKWAFHTVPQAGDEGVETWEDGSWRYAGNNNVWSTMSGDDELGYVYLPIGTATNDYYGAHRPGDNLYSESLVCVNVETGEKVWHFQFVHHGLWDYDLPAAPNLIDIVVDGKPIKAVAQVTKQGFVYVFDRTDGSPVWPIEERPVAPTDMPDDKAAETQPFPTRPAPFEYQGVAIDDLADLTPEIRRLAVEAVEPYVIGPLYTPPSLPKPGGTRGTLFRPSAGGGANWYGAAVDPDTQKLYVPSRNFYSMVSFYSPEEGGTLRFTHGGRGRFPALPDGLHLFKPPYTRITAIDMNRGEHEWMKPLGSGGQYKRSKLLEGVELGELGGDRFTGPLLTKTLLIQGQSGQPEGNRLVARDKATGEVIAEVALASRPLGTPMTYIWQGSQYIALTLAASPVPEMIALKLPN